MIRTVFFDIGNVLVNYSEKKLQSQLAAVLGMNENTMVLHQGIRKLYETGKINTNELCHYLRIQEKKTTSDTEILEAFSDVFWPNSSIFPLIRSLSEQKKRLILLSNTSEAHHLFIEKKFPILEWFDDMVLSYKIGFMKPDPEIFQAALAKAQCKAHECFYIDDVSEFIEAAQKYHIDAKQYTDTNSLVEEFKKREVYI